MSALTIPVPRMTRVTWYRHRVVVLGIGGAFLLAAVLLFADGIAQRDWLAGHDLTNCLVPQKHNAMSWCTSQAYTRFANYGRTNDVIAVVFVLPAVVGLFAGVPWVAREFESGAYRYSWTQSVSPLRSLLGTFGPLVLLAEVTAAICGVAAHWWFAVAQWRLGWESPPWDYRPFEMTPLSLASWTLLVMALALLLGVTIRRVVPAMVAFVVVFTGCAILTKTWLESQLFSIGAIVRRASSDYAGTTFPAWNDYVARTWYTEPNGQRLADLPLVAYSSGNPDRWTAAHHLTYWIAYQPPSRAVWFQLTRNGILVALAVLLVLAAIWWLHKRPAE